MAKFMVHDHMQQHTCNPHVVIGQVVLLEQPTLSVDGDTDSVGQVDRRFGTQARINGPENQKRDA